MTKNLDPFRAVLAALLLTGAVSALACARGPVHQPLGPVPETARLYYDDGGGIQDSVRMVIRGESMWRESWEQATSPRSAPPPLPMVDFATDMVLVVANGRMTPEDRIRVDSVGVREERMADGSDQDVLVVIVRTSLGCRMFNADAYPVEIVRVRRFNGPVNFVERVEEPVDCSGASEP